FPQSLKSVRIIAFAVWFNRCIPKSRTDEHRLFITSLRIRKDFLKACSKASPSASKVFWAGGWIAHFQLQTKPIEVSARRSKRRRPCILGRINFLAVVRLLLSADNCIPTAWSTLFAGTSPNILSRFKCASLEFVGGLVHRSRYIWFLCLMES
ncbi:MAG: hypothetical protein QOH35_5734, partial [Acidobacteriaceae bacterium]|nr:hypothetical protein [Acidobacteriaceae bacterium]